MMRTRKDPNPIPLKERLNVSIKDARDLTGWGRNSIYQMINAGELDTVKVGSRRFIITKSLLAKADAGGRASMEAA